MDSTHRLTANRASQEVKKAQRHLATKGPFWLLKSYYINVVFIVLRKVKYLQTLNSHKRINKIHFSSRLNSLPKGYIIKQGNKLQLIGTPYLLMAESVRIVAIGDLIFFKSQTFTVRSSLPETTLSPTVNTAEVTVLQVKVRHISS